MSNSKPMNKIQNLAYKKISIKLNNFSYLHSQVNGDDSKSLYIGRESLITKLVNILCNTSTGRGSYLISGYRGVGKTSFVNRVLSKYKKNIEDNKFIRIDINLGDKGRLSPQNIYYSIVNILRDNLNEKYRFQNYVKEKYNTLSAIFFIVFISVVLSDDFLRNYFIRNWYLLTVIPVLFFIIREVVYGSRIFVVRDIVDLDDLVMRIENEVTDSKTKGLSNKYIDYSNNRTLKSNFLNAREVEYKLKNIIGRMNAKNINIIFVFDELDKLSEREIDEDDKENKIHNINNLLSGVKNFITTVEARFLFIAGRETLDSYYSERDSANSLYESLFDQVFEIPSLLTDVNSNRDNNASISRNIEKYVCRRLGSENDKTSCDSLYDYFKNNKDMVEHENVREVVLSLRNFIQYLSFHSWGNPKRLSSIFESYISQSTINDICTNESTVAMEESFWLNLSFTQQRSMAFCSGLFTLFHHQLSREVSTIGDKLTVSSLSALQFILKFHQYAFTRESLHRMSEALNIYRAPELNVIVDDLLSHVFKPYIRRVRNGAYRYRFQSGFEQEIRYVSSISELESASFNFSLDAMSRVKSYFKEDFDNLDACGMVRSKAAIVLGDMNAIEQSFNAASKYYAAAIHYLSVEINSDKRDFTHDLDLSTSYIETIIKYGDLEEHRQNYNKAAVFYAQANKFLKDFLPKDKNHLNDIKSGDSKWEVYKHAYWAGIFLSLKRSPASDIKLIQDEQLKNLIYGDEDNDPRYFLRRAHFLFFNGSIRNDTVTENYYLAYSYARKKWANENKICKTDERRDYIINTALTGAAESSLTKKSFDLLMNLREGSANPDYNTIHKGLRTGVVKLINDSSIVGANETSDPGIKTDLFIELEKAAKGFLEINLYTGALITYLKLISYRLTMLDVFSSSSEVGGIVSGSKDIKEYFTQIDFYAKEAAKCISLARQLDSSQSIKTLEIRDYTALDEPESGVDLLTQLFEMFYMDDNKTYPINDNAFWQHSLWGQKLASLLYWSEFVKSKICPDPGRKILPTSIVEKHFEPSKVPSLSIRASILMRWVYSRSLIKERLYDIDKKIKTEGLLIENYNDDANVSQELKDAYVASRNIYYILLDISLISRKNLDLVYPTLAHIYYIQWSLLESVISVVLGSKKTVKENKLLTFRSVCRFVQNKFRQMDNVLGGKEEIAPSHFDYEYIHTKLEINLKDVITINDETSRVRTSILQQKYFFHDDHSDQEFHMDWTLAHMFSPAAYCLLCRVNDKHSKLREMLVINNRGPVHV